MYQITAFRDGLPVYDKPLVVEHKEKVFDVDMPKVLIAKMDYGPPKYKAFSGICWKYSEVLAGVVSFGSLYQRKRVSNLSYKAAGTSIHNPLKPLSKPLDVNPFPDFDLSKSMKRKIAGKTIIPVQTS